MYQSFEAIIDHGHIKFVENVKLPQSGRAYVMIVDDEYGDISSSDWKELMASLKSQRKQKKVKKYSNMDEALGHLNGLMKRT